MHNRLYKYLQSNKLLYNKLFGFKKANSTDHAILQLTDQLYDPFNKYKLTFGVFGDLSKAFETVDQRILLDNLQQCGIE